jgi:hypothetical protein
MLITKRASQSGWSSTHTGTRDSTMKVLTRLHTTKSDWRRATSRFSYPGSASCTSMFGRRFLEPRAIVSR